MTKPPSNGRFFCLKNFLLLPVVSARKQSLRKIQNINSKILQPPFLRELVAEKYREVCSIYKNDLPPVSNNPFRPE